MADEIVSPSATQPHRIFVGSFCEKISYQVKVKQDQVKVNEFLVAVGREGETEPIRGAFACAPGNADSDYHLHVAWRLRKGDFYLEVEFVEGAIAPAPGEREPFAETFVQWAERFFLSKAVRANVDADFVYPSELRQSKFPLPLRAGIGKPENEVTVDGFSFKLPPGIHGIEKIWLTQGDEKLWVHARGERLIDLSNVQVREEIDMVARVIDIFLQETRPDEKAASETGNLS